MKLTFLENKFVLQIDPIEIVMLDFPLKPHWSLVPNVRAFVSTNIKEAVRFRSAADSKAENVFRKLMLKDLPIPSGGPLSPLDLKLYPFQKERGIPHILATNKTYLAHQPGLGKSAQAICAVNTKPGRALFIVPSFLKVTWARELTQWFIGDFPDIAVVPETGKQNEMNWSADFIICSDSMLLKEWVRAALHKERFRYVFIDEGHRFKTPDASRTVALFGGRTLKMKSPGLIYNSEHVCVLSGTPLLNRPIELWPVLFAMAPELIDFMSYQDFGFRYGGAIQDERGHWRFIGSANEDELNKRIMGRFMQRITKDEVLPDLPKKIREIIVVDHDTRAKDVIALDDGCKMRFKKTKIDEADSLGDYAKVRHLNGAAKVEWVAAYVMSILRNDLSEQIILFAHHRDVVDALYQSLIPLHPQVINGGVGEDVRTIIQDEFQSGRCRLIIGNIDAMNLGITLTKATRVMFAEYSWTPANNEQAEDRAHRIGLKDSVFCQYFVLPNSIDEVILNRVLDKETKIGRVMA